MSKDLIVINRSNAVKCNEKFGWELDIVDLAIADAIISMLPNFDDTILTDNVKYFRLNYDLIVEYEPLLPIKSKSGLINRIDKLCKYGILEVNPNFSSYFTVGENSGIFEDAGELIINDKYNFL